jgi:hypothetical protein
MKYPCFRRPLAVFFALCILAVPAVFARADGPDDEAKILEAFHAISSHPLLDYVKELTSEKYGGRLTGTPGYDASAAWVAGLLEKWGVKPAGDGSTWFQSFPNPYTLVLPDGEVSLHIPQKSMKDVIRKYYRYEDEFMPGGTSGSGEVTAEVIYVGYGITAPELGFDEYKGLDVKGKIVLMEPEVPVSPDRSADLFKKWRPYSFHQYKLENAAAHGAAGMLYDYGPICNPNSAYREGFVYCHVGRAVVADVFAGTGRSPNEVLGSIRKTQKPGSFATGKTFTIRTKTIHHPEGVGKNVIGMIEGSDPALKDEVIILGAHIDHLGFCWTMMPGANDNATSVAVMLGTAEALAKCAVRPKRSVLFIGFGAEEQAVAGSEYYVNHPVVPLDRTVAMINMEAAGSGNKINALIGKGWSGLWGHLERANKTYIRRIAETGESSFTARPRQDVARFLWEGVPGLTVGSHGFDPGRPTYHNSHDDMSLVTPEIMEDIARMLFIGILDMANQPVLEFRK